MHPNFQTAIKFVFSRAEDIAYSYTTLLEKTGFSDIIRHPCKDEYGYDSLYLTAIAV